MRQIRLLKVVNEVENTLTLLSDKIDATACEDETLITQYLDLLNSYTVLIGTILGNPEDAFDPDLRDDPTDA